MMTSACAGLLCVLTSATGWADEPSPVSCLVGERAPSGVLFRPHQLSSRAFLLHTPVVRSELAGVLLDERMRRVFKEGEVGLVLAWYRGGERSSAAHEQAARDVAHLRNLARTHEQSVVYLGLHHPDVHTMRSASGELLYAALRDHLRDVDRDQLDMRLLEDLCAILPSDARMQVRSLRRDDQGALDLSISLLFGDEEISFEQGSHGRLDLHLHPSHELARYEHARHTTWLLAALLAALLVTGIVGLRLHSRTRKTPLWQEEGAPDVLCTDAASGDPDVLLYKVLARCRAEVAQMLDALWPTVSRSKSSLYRLVRGHELLHTHRTLHEDHTARLGMLAEEVEELLQGETIWRLVGHSFGARDVRAHPLLKEAARLLDRGLPEFDRRLAPEPWMSTLMAWYVWLDLMVIEVGMRLRIVQVREGM